MEYGLIGEHLSYSYSKDIHERLSPCAYELRELPREGLDAFLREAPFLGINVTIPYKEAVLPYLSWISPEARAIGAVNTIVKRNGRLLGYNTDYFGLKALAARAGVTFRSRRVLILGAGGAAKCARALAQDEGAVSVTHAVRNPREPGQIRLDSLGPDCNCEILINCTPVGVSPNEEDCPADLKSLPCLKGVLDLIYNPLRTNLILDAQEAGIAAEGGLYMLVAQAVAARRVFDGIPGQAGKGVLEIPGQAGDDEDVMAGNDRPSIHGDDTVMAGQPGADVDVMAGSDRPSVDACYNALYRAKRNLVLTGMPTSGKSTLARLVAGKTGRRVVDTDTLIPEKAGKSIRQIFAEDGEARFRAWESEVIGELSRQTGLVIATGGGAVLDWQNVRRLRRNGTILYIQRDLERLTATADRPLSSDRTALEALYERRKAAYERAAEVIIDNNGSLGDSLRQIEALI